MNCVNCGAPGTGGDLYCRGCGLAFIPDTSAGPGPGTAVGWAPVPGTATLVEAAPDSRNWALAAHVSALAGALFGGVAAFVGPLVVWLLRRDDAFAAEHARSALNFNLSVLIYAVVGTVAGVLATVLTLGLALLVLLPALGLALLAYLVVSVLGAVAAYRGRAFRYPLALSLVR